MTKRVVGGVTVSSPETAISLDTILNLSTDVSRVTPVDIPGRPLTTHYVTPVVAQRGIFRVNLPKGVRVTPPTVATSVQERKVVGMEIKRVVRESSLHSLTYTRIVRRRAGTPTCRPIPET